MPVTAKDTYGSPVYACDMCGKEPGSPLHTERGHVVCLKCAGAAVDIILAITATAPPMAASVYGTRI